MAAQFSSWLTVVTTTVGRGLAAGTNMVTSHLHLLLLPSLGQCGSAKSLPIITVDSVSFYFTFMWSLYETSCLYRVCKFQDDRRHHDKCRSHPCWRGAACSAPGKPQPRERQQEEAAKNLSKSPASESEVLQVELNLVAWPQDPFPDIIQFIARQWQKNN